LSRLVVEDQQAFVNEPLFLSVRIDHAAENELLLLDGLVPGTTLSAGTAKSTSSWQVPCDRLDGLHLYAPEDFIGVMNTAVILLGSDKRFLDGRMMQLKWVARQPILVPKTALPEGTASIKLDAGHTSMPVLKPAQPEASASADLKGGQGSVPLSKSALPEVTASVQVDAGHPPMPPMEPSEAALLLQKGRDLVRSGDISAARLVFQRLADSGSAEAALALASTYNPDYLAAHHFVGMRGDRATARALYQRAKELSSADADRFIMQMRRTQ
jgi:hypothetical protein